MLYFISFFGGFVLKRKHCIVFSSCQICSWFAPVVVLVFLMKWPRLISFPIDNSECIGTLESLTQVTRTAMATNLPSHSPFESEFTHILHGIRNGETEKETIGQFLIKKNCFVPKSIMKMLAHNSSFAREKHISFGTRRWSAFESSRYQPIVIAHFI